MIDQLADIYDLFVEQRSCYSGRCSRAHNQQTPQIIARGGGRDVWHQISSARMGLGHARVAARGGSSERQVEAAQFSKDLGHFEESDFQLLYAIEAPLLKRAPHHGGPTALPQ